MVHAEASLGCGKLRWCASLTGVLRYLADSTLGIDGAERLKPEWVRQSPQKFVASVFVNNGFGDDRS